MTKREQMRVAKSKIDDYLLSTDYSLYSVYGRFSEAKQRAWEYCVNKMREYNGESLRIVSHNVNIFTAGFSFINGETGVLQFYYITPNYDIIVDF